MNKVNIKIIILMTAQFVEALTIYICYALLVLFFPIGILFCIKMIAEYQRAVIFRMGRLMPGDARGPGLIFILPCTDDVEVIDLRIDIIDIFPQEVLSKDSVTVTVDAVIYYYIFDPLLAVIKINNFCYSTGMLGATILRNVLGTKDLKSILTDRKSMSEAIQALLDEATDQWGVKVERVELQEIKLPIQMQRAMATEAEAAREAKAKVIAGEGELNASKTLKEASDIMAQGSAALQILTRDSVTVYVDAVVYFKVIDPIAACLKIKNYRDGTNLLSATTLRNELGTKKLSEVLSERESISNSMQELLDGATEYWGVKVERVEIKDVSLPLSMQRAMAAEGEATREAKAKVIAASGELNAAKSLKDASDIIASNPTALQLRYLQTLTTIALEDNRTIIFPLPTDILRRFMPK